MPDRQRVLEFIDRVVSGDHVGAIEDYYHPDASMQENGAEPRRGRDALVAHEAAVLERAIAKRLDGPIRDRAQFRRLYQALLRQGFLPDRVAAALVVRSQGNVVMSGFPDGDP
mgnify:CR=1 FL=1